MEIACLEGSVLNCLHDNYLWEHISIEKEAGRARGGMAIGVDTSL